MSKHEMAPVEQNPAAWIIRHPRFCGKFTDDKEVAEHWENKEQGCTAPLFLHAQPAPCNSKMMWFEMNKASPVDMRKMLEVVNSFKRCGIMFVPIPVLNYEDKAKYIELMSDQLEKMTALAEQEGES